MRSTLCPVKPAVGGQTRRPEFMTLNVKMAQLAHHKQLFDVLRCSYGAHSAFMFHYEMESSGHRPPLLLFVPRGRRWWTRFSTQSASPTAWRSSRWRTQGSNRRFPLSWHILLVESNFLSHLLLAPVAPLCRTLPLLLSPFHLTSHLTSAAVLTSSSSASPPFSLPLSSLSLCSFVQ